MPPPPLVISQTTGPISKIKMPFDSPVREISKHGVKVNLNVTDDVTGQVKVRLLDFSLVKSAGKTSQTNMGVESGERPHPPQSKNQRGTFPKKCISASFFFTH